MYQSSTTARGMGLLPLLFAGLILSLACSSCASFSRFLASMIPKPKIDTVVAAEMKSAPPKTIFLQEDRTDGYGNGGMYQIVIAEFQKAVMVRGYQQIEIAASADAALKVRIVQAGTKREYHQGSGNQPGYETVTGIVKIQASLVNRDGLKLWMGTGDFNAGIDNEQMITDVVKRTAADLASFIGLNAAEEQARIEREEREREERESKSK